MKREREEGRERKIRYKSELKKGKEEQAAKEKKRTKLMRR